jgi:hypothetical protein
VDAPVEIRRIRHWRREQFHELGFTLSEAYELADAPSMSASRAGSSRPAARTHGNTDPDPDHAVEAQPVLVAAAPAFKPPGC